MFVTKKHLSRRTVLRGMGSVMALPFLEALVPAAVPLRRTAALPKSRLACIEVAHGSAGSTEYGLKHHLWAPAKEGPDFEFGPIIRPLGRFRGDVTIVSNTDCNPAVATSPDEVGGDHFRTAAVFLTAARPKQTLGSDVYCGISIDQIYAKRFGQDTPVPSIQLCTEVADASGPCGYKYSCVYMDTISWSSPTTPLPMLFNPRAAFEELFGTGATAEQRAARLRLRRSILDGITSDVERLRANLGPGDRHRLNQYLENAREIERRIQAIEMNDLGRQNRQPAAAPIGAPDSWDQHVKLMMDLTIAGFAGEATRVAALKLGRDVSERVFAESGTETPFHSASHHGNTPSGIEDFAKINTYHAGLLAYFLEKLKNTADGDGSLLDHSLVLYGGAMGDSNVHAHKRVPLLLAGHAGGKLKGNLHVRCQDGTPHANVLLAVMHKLDVRLEKIGNSTGLAAI